MTKARYVLYSAAMAMLMSCNSNQTTTSGKHDGAKESTLQADTLASANSSKQEPEEFTNSSKSPDTGHTERNAPTVQNGTVRNASSGNLKSNPVTDGNAGKNIDNKQPVSLKAEAKKFCDFFKTYEEPSQFFNIPANEIKKVRGKAGTIIQVNPEDLTTLTNQPVDNDVQVELKELTKQEQLLKSNAQTICNGKLLISGGAYYINLKSEGKPVKLKPGKSLSVEFPKLTDAPMVLFAGYRDTLGQMQWQERKLPFRTDPMQQAWRDTRNTIVQYDGDILEIDTLPIRKIKEKTEKEQKKEQAYEKVYAAMDIQSLGWINCDRFYNVSDKTNLSVNIDSREKITFASIYLVFDDINSITQTHYGATENGVSNPGFENIPVGAKARLIAFSLKDEQLVAYSSNLIIKKNETVSIALKETTDEELKKLFAKK